MSPTPLSSGWELQFRLACAERGGDAYQDLFASIMERRDPGFQRVRPWGNQGDRKNDGWSPARRMLFQSYAPAAFKESVLVAKMEEDYEGASTYWKEYFDTWVFVHNDAGGMAPSVARKVAELDKRSAEIGCVAWGPAELREEFACLSDSDRTAILGPPLTPHDFLGVSAGTLRPLIAMLGHALPPAKADVKPVPYDKAEANELEPAQVEFLTLGSLRAPLVGQFLLSAFVMPSYADEVAKAVADRYEEMRAAGLPSSVVFDRLLAWMSGGAADSTTRASALSVLAYFFERCHIFEAGQGVAQ